MTIRIPLAKPEINDTDREAVMSILRTPHLSMGPKVEEFERAMCDYTGSAHAVAVNSGTSALQLAIRALEIERGAEVMLPSFTFSAVLNVVLPEGLRPRLVDIDPAAYNCTAEAVQAAVTPETQLIVAVHTFGFPVDVIAMQQAARALSAGRRVRGAGCRRAWPEGRDGCRCRTLCFYPNKQITTGEGGMLLTSNDKLARKAVQLRHQGRDPSLGWNSHADVGSSYHLADINCALGISQLARIENTIAKRQRIAESYDRELARIPETVRPPLASDVGRISWFVYPVQLTQEFTAGDRDRICEAMLHKGIATGRYFAPLHRQPVIRTTAKPFTTEDTEVHRGRHREKP
jgi:perosamine synthetase